MARHPLLVAIAIWSMVHSTGAGGSAHVLLFGSFAGFAILGMCMLDRRGRRILGKTEWAGPAARTLAWPLGAMADGRWRPAKAPYAARLAAGLLLWLALLALHPAATSVLPLLLG